jgi:MoaA/NifB/PqqE/SkfB family radical SAM enzyme
LSWQAYPPIDDLLASPVTNAIHIEFTSRCNLRCVYCAVSQPTYKGQDMEVDDFDNVVAMLKKRRVKAVSVNGHGETTMIPGWHHRVMALANAGFTLAIISNFARLLSPEELEAMAHISSIEVSVDTHIPEILRKVRRHVDLGNILVNMMGVRAKAAALGLPQPFFSWSCVVTDKVVPYFVDYVRFALACGVRKITVCNLMKYDDLENVDNTQHVTTLPDDKLEQFATLLEEAQGIIKEANAQMYIQAGLTDSIAQELATRKAKRQ